MSKSFFLYIITLLLFLFPVVVSADVVCGDGSCACEGIETHSNCPQDCNYGDCGEIIYETCEEIDLVARAEACKASCESGNASYSCNGSSDHSYPYTETCDCLPPECGDGKCNGDETTATCPDDCGTSCGDGACNGDETTATCSDDCGTSCGDGTCNGDETTATCPDDCGTSCGDGTCNGNETADSCADDCGSEENTKLCSEARAVLKEMCGDVGISESYDYGNCIGKCKDDSLCQWFFYGDTIKKIHNGGRPRTFQYFILNYDETNSEFFRTIDGSFILNRGEHCFYSFASRCGIDFSGKAKTKECSYSKEIYRLTNFDMREMVTSVVGSKNVYLYKDRPINCCAPYKEKKALECEAKGEELSWNDNNCTGSCIGSGPSSGSGSSGDVTDWLEENFITKKIKDHPLDVDDEEIQSEYSKEKQKYDTKVSELKNKFKSKFDRLGNLRRSPGLPSWQIETSLFSFSLDFNKFPQVFNLLGIGIMIVSYLSAIFIVFDL